MFEEESGPSDPRSSDNKQQSGRGGKSKKKKSGDNRPRASGGIGGHEQQGLGGGFTKSPRAAAPFPTTPPPITSDTVVSLSSKGMEFYNQMLATFSAEAGAELTGHDLMEAFDRVRKETGIKDLDFGNKVVTTAFIKVIRAIGAEKRAGGGRL